jgi:glutamine---fructose-6-phosphate transaminase (isomerizing)
MKSYFIRKKSMHIPPYRCYQEIITQPAAWRAAYNEVRRKEKIIRKFFLEKQPTDILVLGCGSPFYMGESISVYWQQALQLRCTTTPSSEFLYYPDAYLPPAGSSPVLVLVSRSGATTETIWAAEKFERMHPGRTLLVSCSPGSPLDQMAALSILIPEGMEQTVPQTASFSAMYLALQMVAALLAGHGSVVDRLETAPEAAERIIARWEKTAQLAASESGIDHAFYMGAGPLYGVTREGALKMTEMSLTTCSAYTFMESRHGPRAILSPHTLLTGLFGRAASVEEAKVMSDFIGTDNPVSVALTPGEEWQTGGARHHIPVDLDWPDAILGLAYLPVLHLLAYYRAVANGVNPDISHNLVPYIDLNGA